MSDGTMQALLAELVHLRRRVERLETIENLNMAQVAAEYVPTLADQGQATVLGRASGAGTGAPSALTAAQLVAVVATADGTGSGLDADTVDGSHASAFAATSHTHGTSGIDDAAVTLAKLANQAQATVIGRAAAAGTGVPVALTAAQLIAVLATADGTGSGLDADLLDGYEAAALAILSAANSFAARQTITGGAANVYLYLNSTAASQNVELRFANAGTDAGRLLYTGSASAGFKYFGFINSSADYLMFSSDYVRWMDSAASATLMRLSSAGLSIGVASDATAPLDVNGDVIRLRTAKTPASAAAAGNEGDLCADASYIYRCTATNTWKRAPIATW